MIFEILLSILLGIYPKVELLDHLVVLFLICGGNSILSSVVLCHFTVPLTGPKSSSFPTSSPTLVIFYLIDSSHPGGYVELAVLNDKGKSSVRLNL